MLFGAMYCRSVFNLLVVALLITIYIVPTYSYWYDPWINSFGWSSSTDKATTINSPNNLRDISRYSTEADDGRINYLENLITQAQQNGLTYLLPTNARKYMALYNDNSMDLGIFDFIIVGAGSCGTVIANRLSEKPSWNVLLLEAGDFGDNLTDIPSMIVPVQFTKYNWGFTSTPQTTSCLGMENRRCPMPRGRGVGGTTLINGQVYSRGSSLDFDRWANHVNDPRWSFRMVENYFRKSENFYHRDRDAPVYEPTHGRNGELLVEYNLPRSPQLNAFLKANEELHLPLADYNAGTGLGASPAQIHTGFGRRFDSGKAFIHSILNRVNLKVMPNSYVTKILIHEESKTAYGVTFTHNGHNYIARAKKEVILSAGVFNTPQLLMLSGIGPKQHLESKNIHVIQDLEVGSTLRDHPCFYGLNFGTNYTEPVRPLSYYINEYLHGYGTLASFGNNQGVGFYESQFTKGTGYPDIEIMLIAANATSDLSQRAYRLTNETYEDLWARINRTNTYLMYVAALHVESTGTVRLKNNNPFEYPLIDSNFLSDINNKDIRTIREGIDIALRLSSTHALQSIDATLQGGPLRACAQFEYLSDAYWYCAIRQVTTDLYHPVGTCPMGQYPERGDVVNSKLQVYGINKLRVADASVFPFTLAGHSHAPVVMIGEVLSDILKEEHGLL